MKLTFIRPSMTGKQTSDALKPLVFAILYSLTPKDVTVQFYDECVEKLPERVDGDAVVFSVETLAAKRVYALAKKYKQENPDIKVIMGGHHPTAVPDEVLQHADCIVTGDAEPVWGTLIADLKENALKPLYTSTNNYILPYLETDQSIFEGKKYSRVGFYMTASGGFTMITGSITQLLFRRT